MKLALPTKPSPTPNMRHLARLLELLWGLRYAAEDDRPLPCAARFLAALLGPDLHKDTVCRTLRRLRDAGAIRFAGALPPRNGWPRGTHLYEPVLVSAEPPVGKREPIRVEVVPEPLVEQPQQLAMLEADGGNGGAPQHGSFDVDGRKRVTAPRHRAGERGEDTGQARTGHRSEAIAPAGDLIRRLVSEFDAAEELPNPCRNDRHAGRVWRLADGGGPWQCGVCHPPAIPNIELHPARSEAPR